MSEVWSSSVSSKLFLSFNDIGTSHFGSLVSSILTFTYFSNFSDDIYNYKQDTKLFINRTNVTYLMVV